MDASPIRIQKLQLLVLKRKEQNAPAGSQNRVAVIEETALLLLSDEEEEEDEKEKEKNLPSILNGDGWPPTVREASILLLDFLSVSSGVSEARAPENLGTVCSSSRSLCLPPLDHE